MTINETRDILEGILNRIRDEHGIDLYPPPPKRLLFPDGFRWRYYGKLKLQRGIKAYCYSTTKNANCKYLSWIYQPRIAKECWDFVDIREQRQAQGCQGQGIQVITMTINPNWKTDPREAYEPELCRLRNVYRTIPARKQFYCDQCHGVIDKGESHDIVAVAGAGIGGYTHPSRLHLGCREKHIEKVNQKYAEGYGIFLYFCSWCGKYKEYKDYGGQAGLSHGICESCSIDETPSRYAELVGKE